MEQQIYQQTVVAAPVVDRQFNEECLEAHNVYRALHGCPPLVFSAKLARQAQKWAEQLAIAGYLKHSPNAAGNFGENVALKMALRSRDYRGSQAAAQWYSEIEMYDFDGKENQSRCGHFSQVVWKSTRKVGFGKAVSEEDGKMFAVGHYFPPGNMLNCWVANIPQPLSGQINIPSHEDIMGADVSQSATKEFSSNQPLVDDSNPASRLLLTASQEFGDLTQFEPKPKDSQDRQIGKSTKTRILNGEKSLIITVTFMRPDGSRYQVTDQIAVQDSSGLIPTGSRHHHHHEAYDDDNDGEDTNCAGFSPSRFAAEMLQAHNKLREQHKVPELHRSDSLNSLAQKWAEQLLLDGNSLRRCESAEARSLGQSVARRPGSWTALRPAPPGLGPAAQLARQWYSEMKGFDFSRLGDETRCELNGGHFTQMVWRATKKLGVGCAVDANTGNACAVCFYHPCGNIAGQFSDNVPPPYE
ncbi:hypothetical protein BOX15_Mlig022429g2 [Macrostomum lignano]|uniref:SCP domain-containing protein n=1 Tax=Macrostomum lignano TaxID=282301 RepID=A0A267GFZ6_9PLAT|nr:hypothetical protein BOX15_Mlig022429g2 [Macrostomum lignano]